MIQRIQTVYLAIAAILLAVAYFFPVMSFINEGQVWLEVYLKGFQDNSAPALGLNKLILLPLQLLNAIVIIMACFAIFLYKNRKIQLRVVRLGIVLILVVVALIFFYYGNILGKTTSTVPDFNHTGIYLILGSLVMFVLANRSIRKDDKLVRSADRLR
jgi:amino acid permease